MRARSTWQSTEHVSHNDQQKHANRHARLAVDASTRLQILRSNARPVKQPHQAAKQVLRLARCQASTFGSASAGSEHRIEAIDVKGQVCRRILAQNMAWDLCENHVDWVRRGQASRTSPTVLRTALITAGMPISATVSIHNTVMPTFSA